MHHKPATYHITLEDYIQAMRLHARPTPKIILLYLFAALGVVMFAVTALQIDVNDAHTILVGAASGLGFALLLLGIHLVSTEFLSRVNYRRFRGLHHDVVIELIDNGVHLSSATFDSSLAWRNMLKWKHDKNYILIYRHPLLINIVPKSVKADGFDTTALMRRLLQYVGRPA